MGLVVRHLINVAYKAINFVLIHLRALNRFRGFCFWPLFLLFICFFLFWRARAQRSDFLEASKQTKKRLEVNKNLIPNIQIQFQASTSPRAATATATAAEDRQEVNGNNIKSQFHQWALSLLLSSPPVMSPKLRKREREALS